MANCAELASQSRTNRHRDRPKLKALATALPIQELEDPVPDIIGHVEAIYRYPVKSMRGESLDAAALGWHGIDGDRRLAFRRLDANGGFPWLTAGKCPDLIRFTPLRSQIGQADALPDLVRTPEGAQLPLFGEALAKEVGRRCDSPVQMMQLNQGIFDEGTVSVIATDTVKEICRLAGQETDERRFRPNIVIRSSHAVPFIESQWVGGVIAFGDTDPAPAVHVTMEDARCGMVNFDPDEDRTAPAVLKAIVRANANNAGVYATVTRIGRVAVGQAVVLHR